MSRPVVVYDANVLYPAQLRDFLMRVAVSGAARVHWTPEIHEEWMQNVHADYPDIEWADLREIRALMDEALPDASIVGYRDRIDDLALPDPDDRHVLAAAIHADADAIVTFNTADFPAQSLREYDLEALPPDAFGLRLLNQFPDRVLDAAAQHRASLTRPSKAEDEYLDLLRSSGLTQTADRLDAKRDRL